MITIDGRRLRDANHVDELIMAADNASGLRSTGNYDHHLQETACGRLLARRRCIPCTSTIGDDVA